MVQPFDIVTVNVSQTIAPQPNTLQKRGALVSMGATSLTPGTYQYLSQLSDLTAILLPGDVKTNGGNLVWNNGFVGGFYNTGPYFPVGTFNATIAGVTPSAYNGTYPVIFSSVGMGAQPFSYALADPGTSPSTLPGTIQATGVTELLAMATTFFAQGNTQGVWVLELGSITAAAGVTALNTFVTAHPHQFYSYLVPKAFSGESTWFTFLAGFESDTAQTYFFCTATSGNYTSYTAQMKCAFVMIQAPSTPVTEVSCAAPFYKALNYAPSSTNKVTPFAYSFLFGVTPYPPSGNSSILATYKAAGVNVVGTGAEGGISTAVLFWGTTKDGRDFTYWYSVDWAQINADLDLANEVINGSNNPLAPLYYDQNGINRLQARAQGTMNRGITYGLLLAPVVVNAVPFTTYVADNPNDYPIGAYGGLSATFVPNRGFKSITINLQVADLPQA